MKPRLSIFHFAAICSMLLCVPSMAEISFTYTINGKCAPVEVDFINTSTEGINFTWYINGSSLNAHDTSYTFENSGSYYISLTAYDESFGYIGSTYMYIYIEGIPYFDFDIEADSACKSDVVQLNASNTYALHSWHFDFDDGRISTNSEATHRFANPGTYNVKLIGRSALCGTDTVTKTILIKDDMVLSHASLDYSISKHEICPGSSVSFSASGALASTYQWMFGDGTTSMCPDVEYGYSEEGTYPVELMLTNGCGYDTTFYDTIWVNNPGYFMNNIKINKSADTICPGTEVDFNSTYGYAYYDWVFSGDTVLRRYSSASHRFMEEGIHPISLTTTDFCGNDTTVHDTIVVASNRPIEMIEYDIESRTVCPTEDIFFTVEGVWDFIEWSFGDGTTENNTDYGMYEGDEFVLMHSYNEAGSYPVTLSLVNLCGADTMLYDTVMIENDLPFSSYFNRYVSPHTSCPGASISFYVSKSPAYDQYWIIDGDTVHDNSFSQIFNTPGTHYTDLVLTNKCGADTLIRDSILITELPFGGIEYYISPKYVCPNDPVSMNIYIDEDSEDFVLHFGDGDSTNYTYNSHAYEAPGMYPVKFSFTNKCGNDTTVHDTIYVVDNLTGMTPPTIYFSSVLACPGSEIELDSYGDYSSYYWNLGDGNTSMDESLFHTYNHTGFYNVELKVKNACGDSSKSNKLLQIKDDIPVVFTNEIYDYVCPGEYVYFYCNIYSPGNYDDYTISWIFDDDTINGQYINKQFPEIGVYSYRLVVESNCGIQRSTSGEVHIVKGTGYFELEIDTYPESACPGDMIYFEYYGESSSIEILEWNFGDGTTSSDEYPVHSFASVGNYDISVKAVSGCGDTLTFYNTISITNTTVPNENDYELDLLEDEVCPGDDVLAFAYPSGSLKSVDFGDGTIVTEFETITSETDVEIATHSYSSEGTYDVKITIENGCGNSLTVTRQVYVSTSLNEVSADIDMYEYDTCVASPVYFEGYGGSAHKWIFGDGTTEEVNEPYSYVSHAYSAPGDYTVKLVATNSCGASDTAMYYVHIGECGVKGLITVSDMDTCVNENITFNGVGGDSHKWLFGDGGSETVSGPTSTVDHIYSDAGTYTVQLIVTKGDASDTASYKIMIKACDGTAITSVYNTGNYRLYPNPANEMLVVKTFSQYDKEIKISVVTPVGRTITTYREHLITGQNFVYLNVSYLNDGHYLFVIESELGQSVYPVQIE